MLGRLHRRRTWRGPLKSFADVNEQCPRGALALTRCASSATPSPWSSPRTRAEAVDAVELVDVDYEDLPVVTDVEAAVADGAPLQFEDLGTNVAVRRHDKDRSDPFEGSRPRRPGADGQPARRGRADRGQRHPGRARPDSDRTGASPSGSPRSTPTTRATCSPTPSVSPRTTSASSRPTSAGRSAARPASAPTTRRSRSRPSGSAAPSSGPRPAARRCSRCTAVARCSTPSWA